MAIITPTTIPLALPRQSRRSYYYRHHKGSPLLTHKNTHHRRPPRPPSPAELAAFGTSLQNQARMWTPIITSWWENNTTPFPKPSWIDLAATAPQTDWFGRTKLMTGFQFFHWYQRRSLVSEGWIPSAPTPSATYTLPHDHGESIPYPDYPRTAWAPPPTPTPYAATIVAPFYWNLTIDLPPSDFGWTIAVYTVLSPPNPDSTLLPHYDALFATDEPGAPYETSWTIGFGQWLPQWQPKPGRQFQFGTAISDREFRIHGPISWITLQA